MRKGTPTNWTGTDPKAQADRRMFWLSEKYWPDAIVASTMVPVLSAMLLPCNTHRHRQTIVHPVFLRQMTECKQRDGVRYDVKSKICCFIAAYRVCPLLCLKCFITALCLLNQRYFSAEPDIHDECFCCVPKLNLRQELRAG